MEASKLNVAVIIAATVQGTALVATALYLGFDGILLTGWLVVLGGVAGYNYKDIRSKINPSLAKPP